MDPIGKAEYEQIVLSAYEARPGESAEAAGRRGAEVVSQIGLMRDALLRPREAAAARWSDLTLFEDGTGRLAIPARKTPGPRVGDVSAETMTALQGLRNAREALGPGGDGQDDRIFPVSPAVLSRRIRLACQAAGLEGRYGGMSPRIGIARELAWSGSVYPR